MCASCLYHHRGRVQRHVARHVRCASHKSVDFQMVIDKFHFGIVSASVCIPAHAYSVCMCLCLLILCMDMLFSY